MFTHKDVKEHEEYIEELKSFIKQLKAENELPYTTSSQRSCNEYMIDTFSNTVKVCQSKVRYMKLDIDNPTPPQPHVMDARLTNPSLTRSPRAFLAN